MRKGKSIHRDAFIKNEPLYKIVGEKEDKFSSRVISGTGSYEITLLQ